MRWSASSAIYGLPPPAALANLGTEDWETVEATRAKAGSALSRPAG